jgi:hypothetical protein
MSYKDFAASTKTGTFAPFIKAKYIKAFPLKVEIVSVDKQTLPNTGPSLVARIRLNAALKSKLTGEYIESLTKVKAKDIGFPLNKTNAKAFAQLFGDTIKDWQGTVTLVSVPVNNPKSGELVQGLVVLTQGQ